MESLYTFTAFTEEYTGMLDDILRMVTIQVVIQFLYYLNNTDTPFWSSDFVLLVLYVVLAVCFYWLVVKKLVTIKPIHVILQTQGDKGHQGK